MARNSSASKEDQISLTLKEFTTPAGRMKGKHAVDELTKKKVNIIRLSEDNDLPLGIEDMAAEFSQVSNGEIISAISPICLRLKKEEYSRKLEIGTLEKIGDLMKKFAMGEDKIPFIRFEKVQILYSPLFANRENCSGKIEITLEDKTAVETKNKVIQSVTFKMGEIAVMELSMDFFVRKCDSKNITINITADGIPVKDRSYGQMMIGIYAHYDHCPIPVESRPSTLIYCDALERPNDKNKESVFRTIAKQTQKAIDEKAEKNKKKKKIEEKTLADARSNCSIVKVDEDEEKCEFADDMSSCSMKSKMPRKKRPVHDLFHSNNHGLPYILDCNGKNHVFKCDEDQVELDGQEVVRFNITLQGTNETLPSAHLTSRDIEFNVLSYKALKQAKIVDEMVDIGSDTFLKKNGVIKFSFADDDEIGRVMKDKYWNNWKKLQT